MLELKVFYKVLQSAEDGFYSFNLKLAPTYDCNNYRWRCSVFQETEIKACRIYKGTVEFNSS